MEKFLAAFLSKPRFESNETEEHSAQFPQCFFNDLKEQRVAVFVSIVRDLEKEKKKNVPAKCFLSLNGF